MFTIARYQIHFLIVQSTHSMLFYTLKNTHTDDDLWCYELMKQRSWDISCDMLSF